MTSTFSPGAANIAQALQLSLRSDLPWAHVVVDLFPGRGEYVGQVRFTDAGDVVLWTIAGHPSGGFLEELGRGLVLKASGILADVDALRERRRLLTFPKDAVRRVEILASPEHAHLCAQWVAQRAPRPRPMQLTFADGSFTFGDVTEIVVGAEVWLRVEREGAAVTDFPLATVTRRSLLTEDPPEGDPP